MDLFRKKSAESYIEEGLAGDQSTKLKKTLGAMDLTILGVGAIIGTGIFVLTGVAAAEHAGPGLVLSFIIAAIACVLAALCYSEFASSVPVSGSAYAYSYTAFGEMIAWILGWDLALEYGVSGAAVASGWSGYLKGLLDGFGIQLPTAISGAFNMTEGTYIDLPAVVIVLLITYMLTRGIQETARFNTIMVVIKIAVILLFVVVGVFYVKPSNWSPFLPYGMSGVFNGAAAVFFAYIGFDALSTAAEEVKNPQRDLPIGIISSLAVCTVLYIVVALVITGIVPFGLLNVTDPVAFALRFVNQNLVAGLVSVGAIAGMTTVLLVLLYGQSRLLFAISRDGMLPKVLSNIHVKTQVPVVGTWVTGVLVALLAGLMPLEKLASLTSIGTLFAFAVVSLGIIVMRITSPNLPRGFRVPWVPFIPLLSAGACFYLMLNIDKETWLGFLLWLLIGIIIYFAYGYRHSKLNK
ncbi:amino acid permease [Paenibacillus macquariensis]|uniref:Amino acid/polyamine/organocation transporter, APC superfamily n=1 Tax=Paenibacillus macquariensis TaxID=948756 RepID=A0ABY1K7H5_9BACL|nr:amino acid permease [Paenibacillus macquariensis]MEC0091102.1 amino acid permease [Paenibacillus macquariensis]OAB33711.1 amino acid permease [Paenibacillus macquariensis subsp. macquariensis]SIR37451.1 amino acid/polyamine/organocation transporter, APC superfamily [Paenibacillus macquariensis]